MSIHPHEDLSAYALGALEEHERQELASHLATCEECRNELQELQAMSRLLGELPPEAMLDGPPEGGDLLLQRTINQVRAERRSEVVRRRWQTGVAASVAALALVGGGVVVGRSSVDPIAISPPVTSTTTAVPGTQVLSASDTTTGAALSAQVVPAAGWVRITVQVRGIPAGKRCRIVVVARDGTREVAGSWLVSPKGATAGTTLSGSAIVDPSQLAAIVIESVDGEQFVTAPRA